MKTKEEEIAVPHELDDRATGNGDIVEPGPDLGDLVIVLLAGTLAGLRSRLEADGFSAASELVADLVEVVDDYLTSEAGPGL